MNAKRILLALVCVMAMTGMLRAKGIGDLIENGDVEGLRKLIEKDPGVVNRVLEDMNMEQTPLHLAAKAGTPEVVSLLLEKGANPNVRDKEGQTPLYAMAMFAEHRAEIAAMLLKKGADYNVVIEEYGRKGTPLVAAFEHGDVALIAAMLDNGVPLDAKEAAKGRSLLQLAEEYDRGGQRGLMAFLLKRGVAIKGRGAATKLHLTILESSEHDFEQAFDKNIDVNAVDEQGRTALHVACTAKRESGIDQAGLLNKIDLLLKRGANVNVKDKDGETPLHLAAQAGLNAAIEEGLLDHGAKIDEKGRGGATALHRAVWPDELKPKERDVWGRDFSGNLETVTRLIGKKADVNAADAKGRTPLHYAAITGHVEILTLLLAHKADLNAKDSEGNTLLHLAAGAGNEKAAEFLLEKKLSPKVRNNKGLTPLNVAVDARQGRVAEILRQRLAD